MKTNIALLTVSILSLTLLSFKASNVEAIVNSNKPFINERNMESITYIVNKKIKGEGVVTTDYIQKFWINDNKQIDVAEEIIGRNPSLLDMESILLKYE